MAGRVLVDLGAMQGIHVIAKRLPDVPVFVALMTCAVVRFLVLCLGIVRAIEAFGKEAMTGLQMG